MNPAYYRDWRAAHPEYRARQNRLRSERRLRQGRDRTAEYARRASRSIDRTPLPTLHQGHPLFDAARAIVGRDTSTMTVLRDTLYDDLISIATLELLRGGDPAGAVRAFRTVEWAWRRMICPLFAEEGVAA